MADCKICLSDLTSVLDFGKMPLANGFLKSPGEVEFFFHLKLGFCPQCLMAQLEEAVDPPKMFHENYPFYSSSSQRMQHHFQQTAGEIVALLGDNDDPLVIELGCNDGVMLEWLANYNIPHLGIEPSANVARAAEAKGVTTIQDFFSETLARKIRRNYGEADIICGFNVMCHLPDLNDIFKGFSEILSEDGLIFFEDPYLADILAKKSFDQIYDEHVYYFSGASIRALAERHGFELIKMTPLENHGGSMRYYLKRKGKAAPDLSVSLYLEKEKARKIHKVETYRKFQEDVRELAQGLKETLLELKDRGQRIVGYGATSKSTTLLNFAGIDSEILDYISDTTPLKIGKYSPGVHIPVKSYETFQADRPDCVLLLAWNHQKEIFEKEKNFLNRGGKFILPFPKADVKVKDNAK